MKWDEVIPGKPLKYDCNVYLQMCLYGCLSAHTSLYTFSVDVNDLYLLYNEYKVVFVLV